MTPQYQRLAQSVNDERGILNLDVDDPTAIELGSFVFHDGSVFPVSNAPLSETPSQNQTWVAERFLGIALRSHSAGSGKTTIPVATSGVWLVPCEPASVTFGAWLGLAPVGVDGVDGLSNNLVEQVTFPAQAIGRCVRSMEDSALVLVELFSSLRINPRLC